MVANRRTVVTVELACSPHVSKVSTVAGIVGSCSRNAEQLSLSFALASEKGRR